MRVVVTGAAGYVGSVVTRMLVGAGAQVLALDNLAQGHRGAIPKEVEFSHGDIRQQGWLRNYLREIRPDTIVHLAAESLLPNPSVGDPARAFRSNIVGSLNLLEAMAEIGITRILFASTTAVYGDTRAETTSEDAQTSPVNPYAESKLMFERMLSWFQGAYGIRFMSLRWFNAAGAHAGLSERHRPETHLIPRAIAAILAGEELVINGNRYPTPDGTCVREYLHVADVARAFVLALDSLDSHGAETLNLSPPRGHSNIDVIRAVEQATGREAHVTIGPPRPGDVAFIRTSAERASKLLGWNPGQSDLSDIVATALDHEQATGP